MTVKRARHWWMLAGASVVGAALATATLVQVIHSDRPIDGMAAPSSGHPTASEAADAPSTRVEGEGDRNAPVTGLDDHDSDESHLDDVRDELDRIRAEMLELRHAEASP